MKTLNKPQTVLAILFTVVCLFCILSSPLSPLPVKQFDVTFLIPSLVIKIGSIIFFSFCFYIYANDIKKKTIIERQQYFDLFATHPSPMAIVDAETRSILAVNKSAIDCYGYSNEEFLSIKISQIRAEEEHGLLVDDLAAFSKGLKKAGIRQHRKKNGETILAEVSSSEFYFNNKRCVLFLATDITEIVKAQEEKKIAQEETIKQANFTSYVLENFPVDVAVFNQQHQYLFINKTAVKNDEIRKWMIGKDDFDYFARKGTDMSIAKERRDRFLKAVAGESQEWIDEYDMQGKTKYLLRKFFPYYEEGKLKYVYGYGTDITEVKKAQLERDEHIKQLENIAFITSHKIRQPICNLQGLISLIDMEQLDNGNINNIINCMQASITNMDDFTRDLAIRLHEYRQNLAAAKNGV